MGGLGKQSKRKGQIRAAQMSAEPEREPTWFPPPAEECEESAGFSFPPDGANPNEHRIIVRMVSHVATNHTVEFAVMQQTHHRGKWRDVASVDSCHNVEVHLHRYGRKAGVRVGEPEQLLPIKEQSDVEDGYDLAYVRLAEDWSANYQRWHDA